MADSGPPSSILSVRKSSWRERSNLSWRKGRRFRRYIALRLSIAVGGERGELREEKQLVWRKGKIYLRHIVE